MEKYFLKIVSFKTTISQKKCEAQSILHQKVYFYLTIKYQVLPEGLFNIDHILIILPFNRLI